jgi:hypothetical protein
MKLSKMFGAAVIGSTLVFSTIAQAACPAEGCPKGYACAGNPIYSTCVKVEKKTKTKTSSATNASPVVLGYVL